MHDGNVLSGPPHGGENARWHHPTGPSWRKMDDGNGLTDPTHEKNAWWQ